MRKLLTLVLSFAVLTGLFAANLMAQNGEVRAADEGTDIEIDGELDVTHFYRDADIRNILNGGTNADRNEWSFLYEYEIGFDIQLGDDVSGYVSLENDPVGAALPTGSPPVGAPANTPATIGAGGTQSGVGLGQAYIDTGNFISEGVSLRLGIQDYKTDLRGDGNSFLIDLRNSDRIGGAWGHSLQESYGLTNRVAPRENTYNSGGALVSMDFEPGTLDLFWFNKSLSNLTNTRHTDGIGGGVFKGTFQNDSSYLLTANVFSLNSMSPRNSAQIWNFGGGVDYAMNDSTDIFGELYFQTGEYIAQNDGVADHSSFAGYIGAEHDTGNYQFGGQFAYLGGDDGEFHSDDTNDSESFRSYSNWGDTAILENRTLGIGLDTNYWKVQGHIGGQINEDMDVKFLAGYFQNTESPDLGGSDLNDDLGIETDLKASWTYSENLSVDATLAHVWSADFFNDSNGFNVNNSFSLFTLGANLDF